MQRKGANISLKGYDDIFSTEQSRAESQQERVQEIPLSELHPFEGHPFRVVDDEEMMKTAESVRDFGVLTPAIVPPAPDGGYEIVSGHRRHRASELAGKETMPAIVRDLDDDAAIILMVDANLQRETILPSERAFAYKMKLDAMNHQGARSDLTCSQIGNKLEGKKSSEIMAEEMGTSKNQIFRYINLAFSCSLRMGELLGLTWDCIDISPTSIELGQASIFVEKELQRVNREAMADLDDKDIMFKFPPTFASTHTALVLKTPKTKTSVRKVFLPKTVAEMLVQRKADIEELKDLFGDEFVDFNLVFCSSNGKPIEGQVINRAFNKLIEENGLPKVVFHSLRHSSITYKLKLNGGDMKSVQGDSGHAQVKMVADVYSHIIDDDRRLNAERMEAAFYSGRQATPEPVQPAATESSADDKELLLKLLQNPEMAALLKSLAKTL